MSKTTEWLLEQEQKGKKVLNEPGYPRDTTPEKTEPLSLEEFEKQWSKL